MSYYDVVEYLKECQQEKELQNKIAKEFELDNPVNLSAYADMFGFGAIKSSPEI